MRIVYKCSQCKTGPCYCTAENNFCPGEYGGQEAYDPGHCPFSAYDETPDWEKLEPVHITNPGFQRLLDWLSGEGYENSSPALRDAIFASGFEAKSWVDGAAYATDLLSELEATSPCLSYSVWQEMKEKVRKLKKPELVAMTWNRAFQVGLMMAEKIRVELEERKAKGERPFEY